MTEKRFIGNFQGKMLVSIRDKKNNCNVNILQVVEIANKLSNENEQLKKKILEEIDLEVAYINETYSDGRMSEEQHDGAIISLRQLREKFE